MLKNLVSSLVKYLDNKFELDIEYNAYLRLSQLDTKKRFETFKNTFNNEYGKRVSSVQLDTFRKGMAKKFADNISLNIIFSTMQGKITTCPYELMTEIFLSNGNTITIDESTVYIAYPWSGENLTGSTNAYLGVVGNKFIQCPTNHKGFYFEDINFAVVFNGNHSITIGKFMDNIDIITNNVFQAGIRNNTLQTATLSHEEIKINGKVIKITLEWAMFLYILQKI